MKEHYLGHRERLRKKYIKKGIEALSDYEIIELLLFFSIPVKDVKPIAKSIIKKYGNIKEIFLNLNLKDFLEIKGVGEKSFILFKLIKDINKIIEYESFIERTKIRAIIDVIRYSKNILWDRDIEEFWVIFLNSKNEILKSEKISEGSVNEAYVYIRNLFEKAFEYKATALILIHNHPSGRAHPSSDDINITKKIINLANEFGIVIHDHIIIAKDEYYSFKEKQII